MQSNGEINVLIFRRGCRYNPVPRDPHTFVALLAVRLATSSKVISTKASGCSEGALVDIEAVDRDSPKPRQERQRFLAGG